MNKIYGYGIDKVNKDELYYCFDWIQGSLAEPTYSFVDLNGIHHCSRIDDVLHFIELLSSEVDSRLSFNEFDLAFNGINLYQHRLNFRGGGSIIIGWNDVASGDRDRYESAKDFYRLKKPEIDSSTKLYQGRNPGIFISVSGDGLRFLGENQFKLYEFLYKCGFHCSRLDVACDVFDPNNPFVPFILGVWQSLNSYKIGDPVISSRMNRENFKVYQEFDYTKRKNGVSYNVTCGKTSATSLGYFKLYDKYLEVSQNPRYRGKTKKQYENNPKLKEKCDLSDQMLEMVPEEYWYRFEYAIKSKADYIFSEFMEGRLSTCGCFLWAVKSFFKIGIAKKNYDSSANHSPKYEPTLFDKFIAILEEAAVYAPNSYLAK